MLTTHEGLLVPPVILVIIDDPSSLKVFLAWIYNPFEIVFLKNRIRGTPSLSTDADSRTDTNLKGLRDLSKKNPAYGRQSISWSMRIVAPMP